MAVELVSKGVQDVYLTGKPEVSFFRQNYKRHSNFVQRTVKLNQIGTLAATNEVYIKIPNKGDLLSYFWLDLGSGTVSNSGINADSEIDCAEFELWIGGQLVDRQDAFFMVNHWNKYLADSGSKPSAASSNGDVLSSNWLPLHFFFCDNVYLPLVAMQYHEVEIRIKFASVGDPSNINFYANYVLLDTDERKFFVDTEHEFLIEQVQKIQHSGNKFDLTFLNHPVKSLHWSNVGIGGGGVIDTTSGVQLYLNGTEIFGTPMPLKYFNQVQGYYHSDYANAELSKTNSQIYMHSFALKASKHQPTGSCNFSRLDTGALNIAAAPGQTPLNYLYAVNFNILRIKNGLTGVAFSN